VTFGKEGHRQGKVSQYLPAAEEPAELRVNKRREIIDDLLPRIVAEVLVTPEIAAGVEQARMNPDRLLLEVVDNREEALAPANVHLERAVDAVLKAPGGVTPKEPRPARLGGITMMLLGGVGVVGLVLLFALLWPHFVWWLAMLSVAGALFVGFWAVMIFIAGVGLYRGKPLGNTAAATAALATWRQVCRDEGVLPYVRRLLDEHLEPINRVQLGVTTKDAPGLLGTGESSYMVRTRSVEAFLAAAGRLPTGAVGLSGPRGVGKTSLIEYFAGRGVDGGRRALKVTVSAPVQYEPRDFVLHLFATVCEAVLRERSPKPSRPSTRARIAGWLSGAVMAFNMIGLVSTVSTERVNANTIVGASAFTVLAALLALPMLLARARRHEGDVVGLARQHLRNIQYLQTHTSGWSGKVTLPLSPEAGWSRQTQRERRPQTYPELVGALREFLAAFAQSESVSPAMIIAVDELDKIESADDAQRFVNEIKGIFGAPGTQFLVSVSEDALASFERRGLPVRDAFDSAFHEIVRVDYLTLADTAELLSSRVLRLPEPFKWLVHCMSGGLPRDVVRTARAMVALTSPDETPPSLDDVCVALVADDLARKSHAFQLACRDIGDSPEVTDFIRSLRKVRADGLFLLALLPNLRMGGELATLSRQAAAYVYYLATLLEVFRRDTVDSHGKDTFDLLARAKQSLAVHPRLAWLQVDEFRESWGLATVPVD
jgi:hypothetical protein